MVTDKQQHLNEKISELQQDVQLYRTQIQS